ncbi:hypothetical protein EDD85DRAFT_820168 [Armillaria nabsnona]|nr:hypothetical protein EDD85DRAFT_820168 [Armillaria nabsnona]
MTPQTNIPADLTEAEKASIVNYLDMDLNAGILISMLNGIYTGIFVVTMWATFTSTSHRISRGILAMIILLYATTEFNLACGWSIRYNFFIKNGQSFWTVYNANPTGRSIDVISEATSIASTIFSDCIIIWRCWNVWGQRWMIILLPVLTFLVEIASRILAATFDLTGDLTLASFYRLLSIIFVLITTVSCTLLIIWRVWTVVRASQAGAANRGFGAYRHTVEILAESSALYSVCLVLYAAISEARGAQRGLEYFDAFAAVSKGVAPTMLVGFIAAGYTRPDDTWKGSVSSSLRFGGPQLRNGSHDGTFVDSDVEGQLEENDIEPARRGSQVDESGLDAYQSGTSLRRDKEIDDYTQAVDTM